MEHLTENQDSENQTKDFSRTFNLKFGYQDKENVEIVHREVVISRRPTGADFLKSMDESEGANPQFMLTMMQAASSKFGDLQMPVPMTVLLSLNWLDQ